MEYQKQGVGSKIGQIFEVVFGFFSATLMTIGFSVISLMLLFPLMLVCNFRFIDDIVREKNTDNILYKFLSTFKRKFKSALKLGVPLMLIIIYLSVSIYLLIPYVSEVLSDTLFIVVLNLNLFVLYQLVSTLFMSTLILSINDEYKNRDILKASFYVVNKNFIRNLLSILSFFVSYLLIGVFSYFWLFIIPIGLLIYRTSFDPVIKEMFDHQGLLK